MPAKTPLTIATWNINSVRLRMPLLQRLAAEARPDVICLQETKVDDSLFPHDPINAMGYTHRAVNGRKGYHGVAILSRLPFKTTNAMQWCEKDDGRHVMVQKLAPSKEVQYVKCSSPGDFMI